MSENYTTDEAPEVVETGLAEDEQTDAADAETADED